jgi:hypothetical protein
MTTPTIQHDRTTCPKCNRVDNVSLQSGDNEVVWCSCGNVYTFYVTGDELVMQAESVFDFAAAGMV